jgi:hypothetical protein
MGTFLAAILPKKILIDILLNLAEWAAQQTDNKVDDKIVKSLVDSFKT